MNLLENQHFGRQNMPAAQVNKNGGVNGCNVRIVSENTGSDNSKALSLYQGASRTASAVLGPVDAPETVYIAQNTEKNGTVHLAAYSYEESRQLMAPYGISYMSDSEDGELEEVQMWGQQNPDIKILYCIPCHRMNPRKIPQRCLRIRCRILV